MGRIRTPRYRVEYLQVSKGHWTNAAWRLAGKPTNDKLLTHITALEQSTLPGGVNAHIGPTRILKAQVVDQFTQTVVASFPTTETK